MNITLSLGHLHTARLVGEEESEDEEESLVAVCQSCSKNVSGGSAESPLAPDQTDLARRCGSRTCRPTPGAGTPRPHLHSRTSLYQKS